MATYYVKWNATGSGDGTSWDNAYTTIAAACNARKTSGTVIEISGGESGHLYLENIVDGTIGNNVSLRGSITDGHSGKVTIDGNGSTALHVVYNTANIVDMRNLTIKGSGSGKYNLFAAGSLGTLYLEDVDIIDGSSLLYSAHPDNTIVRGSLAGSNVSGNHVIAMGATALTLSMTETEISRNLGRITLVNSCALTANKIRVVDNTAIAAEVIKAGGSATHTITNSIIKGNVAQENNNVIGCEGTCTLNVNHSIVENNSVTTTNCGVLAVKNTGILNVRNSIVKNTNVSDSLSYTFANNGTNKNQLNILNTFILDQPFVSTYGARLFGGSLVGDKYTDGGGNVGLTNAVTLPKFTAPTTTGILSFTIDDAVSVEHFSAVASRLESYGFRGVWCVDTLNMTSSRWSAARDFVVRGHEIASHTRRHVNLDSTKMRALIVTHTGTLTISGGLLTTTGSNPLTIDLSSYIAFEGVKSLASYINGQSGYTCTVHSDAYAGNGSALNLADVVAVDTSSATVLSYDKTRVYADEVVGSRADIEAQIPGYTCKTLVHPGDYFNADTMAAVEAAGYIGARGHNSNATHPVESCQWNIRTGIHPYALRDNVYTGLVGSFVNQGISSLCEQLTSTGGIVAMYGHLETEIPTNVLDIVSASNVSVMTTAQAIEYLKSVGTLQGNGQYKYATVPDQSDYHLQPTSPCIGAGTAITGITTDIEGNQLYPPYNIGPYGAVVGALESAASDYPGRAKYSIVPKGRTGNCATLASGTSIAITGVTGASILSKEGTGTVTIGTNVITRATDGTLYNLKLTLSNGRVLTLPLTEGSGTTVYGYDNTGVNYTGTITTSGINAFWGGKQTTYFPSLQYGYRASGSVFIPANPYTGLACDGNALTAQPLKFNASSLYSLPDAQQVREATGWTYGNANTFFNADGTQKELTFAELDAAGTGLRYYLGTKGTALYSTDQTAKDSLIEKILKV